MALAARRRDVGTALQYRWPDTEWKEEPAEPISDERDLFCT